MQQMKCFIILVCILAQFVASPVQAEEVDKNVKQMFEQSESNTEQENIPTTERETEVLQNQELSFLDFFKLIFATIFVVFLIYAILRFVNKRSRLFNQHKLLENIGGTSLGANRSIQLIKVGNRILIVGVGESIQLLKELDDVTEVDDILADYNSRLDQLIQPRDILSKLAPKKSRNENVDNSFTALLKEQLSEITLKRTKTMEKIDKKGSNKE